jgi:hypothetical protein
MQMARAPSQRSLAPTSISPAIFSRIARAIPIAARHWPSLTCTVETSPEQICEAQKISSHSRTVPSPDDERFLRYHRSSPDQAETGGCAGCKSTLCKAY